MAGDHQRQGVGAAGPADGAGGAAERLGDLAVGAHLARRDGAEHVAEAPLERRRRRRERQREAESRIVEPGGELAHRLGGERVARGASGARRQPLDGGDEVVVDTHAEAPQRRVPDGVECVPVHGVSSSSGAGTLPGPAWRSRSCCSR